MEKIYKQIKRYNELWREGNALYEEWSGKWGVSYFELLILLSLVDEGVTYSQKELCRQWSMPKQTVNTILKNFRKQEWVSLMPSPADKRNKEIILTESGKEYFGMIAAKLQEHEQKVWSKIGEEKADLLIESTALYNRLFREVDKREDS